MHSEPRVEQVLPEESGRLDVVFQESGATVWVDVAVTAATTTCARMLHARAYGDGRVARAEESVKRTRYHSRATPVVFEADGRPGTSARAFVRRFSQTADDGYSTSVSHAWACLSSILQRGNADIEIAAWGPQAVSDGRVVLWSP